MPNLGDTQRRSKGGTPINESRPAAVIFDCGNTLIHADGALLARRLAELSIEVIAPERLYWSLVLASDFQKQDPDKDLLDWWAFLAGFALPASARAPLRSLLADTSFYRQLDFSAIPVLSGLKDRGVRVGVIGNAEGQLWDELERFGLMPYLDVVIDSYVVGIEKPNPRVYALALEKLNAPAAETWFVGDALINDVLGPLAIGIRRAFLFDPTDSRRELPVPRLQSLLEVLAFVDEATI